MAKSAKTTAMSYFKVGAPIVLALSAFYAGIHYWGHLNFISPIAKGVQGDTNGKWNWFGFTR